MAFKIDFIQKYGNLIFRDLTTGKNWFMIPEKYRKKFIHPANGFVAQYCEEYGHDSTQVLQGHRLTDEESRLMEMTEADKAQEYIDIFLDTLFNGR